MTAAAAVAALWLEIVLPAGFPARETASAVVCRARDGAWGPIRWRTDSAPPSRVEGVAGARCRVLVRSAGAATYHASAEVQWSVAAQPVRVHHGPLRTIEAPHVSGPVQWLGAAADDGGECAAVEQVARCLFVPGEQAGVMVSRGADSILFAIVSAGDGGRVIWSGTRWARLLRVRTGLRQPVSARAVTLERVLSQGDGRLLEARGAPSVTVAAVGPSAFWVDGDIKGGFLDVRSPGSATRRLRLEDVLSPVSPALDVVLDVEEIVEGDVRGRGRVAEGATVVLSRVIEGEKPGRDDERYERVAEMRVDSAGTFRFGGLARERYELLAVHSELGRARLTVTPPAFSRLVLKPRAVVRGRVIENGVAVAGARVQVLPALEAVRASRNPLLLATEASVTASGGRFEVIAPDEGRVVLALSTARSGQRIDLGDAAAMGETVDLGDIRLEEPRDIEVIADLPTGCVIRAAGPMGVAGLSIITLSQGAAGRWRFLPPAGGRWVFAAVCGLKELPLDPPMVDVRPGQREAILLKVRRRPVYF